MAPARKQVPVQIPHEDVGSKRRAEDEAPSLIWLDPETKVLLAEKAGIRWADRWADRGLSWNDEEVIPYVIEPLRRQFRENNSWVFRWKPGLRRSTYATVGKRDPRCRRCKRNLRGGCSSHVKWQKVEQPDPKAGKVFKTVSTVKLYGLALGTAILFQKDGKWIPGTVYEHATWRETARADEKAQRKIGNQRRRHARLPSIWERILNDPLGLDDAEGAK